MHLALHTPRGHPKHLEYGPAREPLGPRLSHGVLSGRGEVSLVSSGGSETASETLDVRHAGRHAPPSRPAFDENAGPQSAARLCTLYFGQRTTQEIPMGPHFSSSHDWTA